MANKKELQEQLISLGVEPGEKTVDELKEAIASATPSDTTEEVEENPTVKRQKAANKLRDERKATLKKASKQQEANDDEKKASAEKSEKKEKTARPIYTDDRGLKFAFKRNASASLNIDGKSRKITDIIKDDEVMLELVYGNSNFIEQIL